MTIPKVYCGECKNFSLYKQGGYIQREECLYPENIKTRTARETYRHRAYEYKGQANTPDTINAGNNCPWFAEKAE